MSKDRISIHFLFKLFLVHGLLLFLKNYIENFFKATKWVYWTAFTFKVLKKILCPRIESLKRIFPWSTTTSATGWRVSHFSVWSFRVFLFHMSIKCRIRQISFITIFAHEVSTCTIMFGTTLPRQSK